MLNPLVLQFLHVSRQAPVALHRRQEEDRGSCQRRLPGGLHTCWGIPWGRIQPLPLAQARLIQGCLWRVQCLSCNVITILHSMRQHCLLLQTKPVLLLAFRLGFAQVTPRSVQTCRCCGTAASPAARATASWASNSSSLSIAPQNASDGFTMSWSSPSALRTGIRTAKASLKCQRWWCCCVQP